jgi:hypothetical protein
VVVSLRSGTATAIINGKPWREIVTLASPTPSLWIKHVEDASIEAALKPRTSVSISRANLGGQRAYIVAGSLEWPSSGTVDHTIHAPFLSILGVIDAIALMGGALVLGRWLSRTFQAGARV